MISVKRKVYFVRRDRGQKVIADRPKPAELIESGRTPRISRLMALAIRFDRMIRDGKVADISELARLAHVTQPRMTQIMNLNHLAPDIQEELLFLPRVMMGREPLHEKALRPVAAKTSWNQQRALWRRLHATRRLGS
jgi:hypothetical protein